MNKQEKKVKLGTWQGPPQVNKVKICETVFVDSVVKKKSFFISFF